jgi:predicted Zn-dependent protease
MPLAQLFSITRDSADYTSPEHSGLFYAQSWSLTHMLLTDDRYKDRSAALLATLAHSEPSAQTLTAIYGKPIDEISKDLSKYALRGNYKTSLIDMELSAGTATSVTRPATDFEAGVTLATLMAANQNRHAEAQAAFDALERQNPNDLKLVESLALFAVRTAHIDQARRYLDRAIELKSTNARIYSHSAEWRDRSSTTTEPNVEADALFAKALALAPADPEVRIQMAQSLVRQCRGADAIAMLDTIERAPVEYERLLADTRTAAQELIRSPADFDAAAIPFIR